MKIEINIPDIAYGSESEAAGLFVKRMMTRMEVSTHKYGPVRNNAGVVDNLACAKERIGIYLRTGNTEGLVDAANFLMMEGVFPQHPKAHFRAESAEESPGLIDYRHGDKKPGE